MQKCVDKKCYDDESSEISSNAENLFFCKPVEIQEQIDAAKWEDSEEDESKIRKEYKMLNNYVWKDDAKKEVMQAVASKTSVTLKKKYLRCNNTIKLAKYNGCTVLVTTYNDVYIYESLLANKKYKSINLSFHVTAFDFCNNKIVLVSDRVGILKELNMEDMTCKDIKRGHDKRYKKIVADTKTSDVASNGRLYLMSDKIEVLDAKNYGMIQTLNEQAADFCVSDHLLVILCSDGSLNVYMKSTLAFLYKKVYKDKHFFANIYFCGTHFFVTQDKSVVCFDENFETRKELLKFRVNSIAESKDYYMFGGDGQNQVRIVKKKGMQVLQSFPYSTMQFSGAKCIFAIQNCLFFAHSSFLSRFTITNKQK